MDDNVMINVATDFARSPAGRVLSDGPNSGERFRTDFLVPALESGKQVVINLDGTRGYGSSFLDEAFGFVVRMGLFPGELLERRITLLSNDPSLPIEIKSYFKWPRREVGAAVVH